MAGRVAVPAGVESVPGTPYGCAAAVEFRRSSELVWPDTVGVPIATIAKANREIADRLNFVRFIVTQVFMILFCLDAEANPSRRV